MFVNTCLNFIQLNIFADVNNILFNIALLTCRKCLFIINTLSQDLNYGKNTLNINHFDKFKNSNSFNEIQNNLHNQKDEINKLFLSIVTTMGQYGQVYSNFTNLQQPIDLRTINEHLLSYKNQTKNKNLPYHLENNYSNKRRFYYILASLFKVLYMDQEFPYFLVKKQKKFNWKAFMNEFGNADMSVYMNIVK